MRSSTKGAVSPANSGSPSPSATGWSTSRYSSTRRSLVSDWAKAAPPHAIMSLPGSLLRALISSARSPLAIVDWAQSALASVLENTTFGILFIGAAYSSSEVGQNPAISWYVTRPIRCRPATPSQSSFRSFSAGSSGGTPQSPAPSWPGRATRPSSETSIVSTSFLTMCPFLYDRRFVPTCQSGKLIDRSADKSVRGYCDLAVNADEKGYPGGRGRTG